VVNVSTYSEEAALRWHWGAVYDIRQVSQRKWIAVAKWGDHDMLTGETAASLRHLIHLHYGPETAGYSEAKKIGR
jgi:hypothetical protein